MKQLQILTSLVYLSVAGVVVSFAMSIVTAVKTHKAEAQPAPLSIPLPGSK